MVLAGSGLHYGPVESLGMAATNGSGVVSALLEALQLAPEATLEIKGEATTLGEALTSRFEITAATPRFLGYWAQISEAEALRQLQQDDRDGERSVFLRTHHIVDIVDRKSHRLNSSN